MQRGVREISLTPFSKRTVMDNHLEATPASDIKRPQPVTLPSGQIVLISRVSLRALVKSGKIPNHLAAIAYTYIEGSHHAELEKKKEVDRDELIGQIEDTIDALVKAVVVYPHLVDTLEEEVQASDLWIGRIVENDKTIILSLAQAPLSSLEKFRPGQASFDPGPDSAKISRITLRAR